MATDAPAKPKGKGLNGRIGPVPVKVAIFVAVAALVFLYLHYRAKAAPTSAGSEATPAAADTAPFTGQGDATGGGSSGGSGEGGITSTPEPTAQQPFNFYFSSVPETVGGGNTSTATAPSLNTSTTTAAHPPEQAPTVQSLGLLGGAIGNPGLNLGSVQAQPDRVELPDDVSGSYTPPNQYGGPVPPPIVGPPPPSPNAPYSTKVSANSSGGSANKNQGVFSVH